MDETRFKFCETLQKQKNTKMGTGQNEASCPLHTKEGFKLTLDNI